LNPYGESFDVVINNRSVTMRTKWNDALGVWCLDLGNSSDDWLIRNLALVTGDDLLGQYKHLGLGFALYAYVDGGEGDPDSENLGTDGHLYAVAE
jgi:hypothetical protein